MITPEQTQKIADNIQLLLNAKKYNEVKKLIAQCEMETPHVAEIYAWKANLQLCMGNHMEASHWIQHGLKIDSANLNLNLCCATIAQHNGNYSRAIDHFQKSLHLTNDEHILADIQIELNKLWRLIKTDFAPTFSPRIIIGSPVCQKTTILKEFLLSLTELKKDSLDIAYCFIDGNEDAESSKMLVDFEQSTPNVILYKFNSPTSYHCDEATHHWKEHLVWKVADLKNLIIKIALHSTVDYLFLIDSDIMLHPYSLKNLVSQKKDILSQVFWTNWQPDSVPQPQVWLYDHYTQCYLNNGEKLATLTKNEYNRRMLEFFKMLKNPGTYEVGGLGACTLISNKALKAGVNFSRMHNLTFWGEDRHFCLRAVSLGFPLYADTRYPAYHIYRESALTGVGEFKRNCGYALE